MNEELSYKWNFNARIAQILCLHQRQNSLYDDGKCKKQTKQQKNALKVGKNILVDGLELCERRKLTLCVLLYLTTVYGSILRVIL